MNRQTAWWLVAALSLPLAFGVYRFARHALRPVAAKPNVFDQFDPCARGESTTTKGAPCQVATITPPPGFVLDQPVQLDPQEIERINREAREREAVQEAIHTAVERERRLQPER